MENLVTIIDDKTIVTSSLKVAEMFKKNHSVITDAIKLVQLTLETTEGTQLNFKKANYLDCKNTAQPMYYMDRDAFSVLVYGWSSNDQLRVKKDFLMAFNQKELEILIASKDLVDLKDISKALSIIADKLQEKPIVVEITPAAAYFKSLNELTAPCKKYLGRELGETDAARWIFPTYGLKPTLTTRWFREQGYLTQVPYDRQYPGRKLNIPTTKGREYFKASNNLALYITPKGKELISELQSTGQFPKECQLT